MFPSPRGFVLQSSEQKPSGTPSQILGSEETLRGEG